MDNLDRICEIESALELLGLKKCNYCSSYDKEENFKSIKLKYIDGTYQTKTCCVNCQKEIKNA